MPAQAAIRPQQSMPKVVLEELQPDLERTPAGNSSGHR